MRKNFLHLAKNGIVAFVGFLLSPLSWWNDLVINIPLAYFFAFAAGKLLNFFLEVKKPLFVALAILGYWLTNILGMLMMSHGVQNMLQDELRSKKWARDLVISLVYSLVIVILIYLGQGEISKSINIVPSWVK